ncbi:hypothetical protein K32_08790 [Kaistia sp. 32K]|uniref:CopD family protein n=1 Tax=Kaistia sp. 32K TaxID=2795690 RepID=UPI0019150E0F|nr:CopD family protein [Kaistia sp. 32K]BCP52262.1 hypothetical protein K32_08790 [Kaistia sp. 32K]
MSIVLLSALWIHVAACVLLTGSFSLLLLAGPPPNPIFRRWEGGVLASARWLAIAALLSGVVWLAARTASFEGRAEAAFDPDAILHAMLDTWPGLVLMARLGLLLVLAVLLQLRADVTAKRDWYAVRGEAFALAAVALVLFAASGHSAAISDSLWPQVNDMAHLLSAGVWVGGLPALALLLHAASRSGARPDPYAIRTMQRFSRIALVAVLILAGSGSVSAWLLLEGVPGLLGTLHGHLLLAKFALLFFALLLAAASRARLASLAGSDEATSSQTARAMAWYIAVEAGLVILLVGFASAMTVTAPARHEDPAWPLPFRLSFDAITDGTTSQLFLLPVILLLLAGLAFVLASLVYPGRRRAMITAGAIAVLASFGSALGLWPFVVQAYPTSFVSPPIPYQVGSIVEGMNLSQAAKTDSPASPSPQGYPSASSERRTPGDEFGLLKAEAGELSDEQRWSVVNYLRTAEAAQDERRIGPEVVPDGAWLAAPDFPIAMGTLTPGLLRDYRNRKMVLLVLYSLPDSRERMTELARRYGALSVLGVEVVAVAPTGSPERVAELGASPPALFPVVTEGNEDITAAYRLFAPADTHTEILIDRQGYIRAIWRGSETGMPEASSVQAQVEKLNEEKTPPPLPELHIH